jgi:hypothetical protein
MGNQDLRYVIAKMMENSWVHAPVKPEYLGI